MEIFNKSNTVCLDKEIKRIIQHLNHADKIIGDDDLIMQELEQAQNILDELIVRMQDENAQLVYFSGSFDDFMKKGSRMKKENIEVLCDNDEDMDIVSTIMGFTRAVTAEFNKEQPYETEFKIRRRSV